MKVEDGKINIEGIVTKIEEGDALSKFTIDNTFRFTFWPKTSKPSPRLGDLVSVWVAPKKSLLSENRA